MQVGTGNVNAVGSHDLAELLDPKVAEVVAYQTREEWIAGRSQSIGASEVAAALGHNPWVSPFSLWAIKTGKAPEAEEIPVMRRGHDLEQLVGARLQSESRRAVLRPGPHPHHTVRSVPYPFLSATIDFIEFDLAREGVPGSADAKTVGSRQAEHWVDRESLPHHLVIQIQAQLFVLGWSWGSLAGLMMDSWELMVYDFDAHERFASAAIDELARFWEHVTRDIPPASTTKDDLATLKRMWNHAPDLSIEIGVEFDELWREYQALVSNASDLNASLKAINDRRKSIEAAIRARAQGASLVRVEGTDHAFQFRQHERAGYAVKPTSVQSMKAIEGVVA